MTLRLNLLFSCNSIVLQATCEKSQKHYTYVVFNVNTYNIVICIDK